MTLISIPASIADAVEDVCSLIGARDHTFQFQVTRRNGDTVLVVYSRSQSQAQMRGRWLVSKVPLLHGLQFLAGPEQLEDRLLGLKPAEAESLIALIRRGELRREQVQPKFLGYYEALETIALQETR